jgi:hypothetical protein
MLIRAFIKGLLTFLPGVNYLLKKKRVKSKHSGSNAEFCYTFWLSVLVFFKETGIKPDLNHVGEIGTGGSLGIGICALLTGSTSYAALETENLYNKVENLKLLDEIVHLFKNKTPISDKYKQLNIKITNHEFPEGLINPMYLSIKNISAIREDLEAGCMNSPAFRLVTNWENVKSLELNLIFSRAVMEHVKDSDEVYKAIYFHLKPSSYMLHDIELHSHGITRKSDGHYLIPDMTWKIIYGKRPFYLNRWRLSDHLGAIEKYHFYLSGIQKTTVQGNHDNEPLDYGALILAKK